MPKPNDNYSVKQMKEYIRKKKINHPKVKLSMRRADMIAGLKSIGEWDSSKDKPTPKKTTPVKKAPVKKAPVKKAPKKTKEKKYPVFLLGKVTGNFEKGAFIRVSKFEAKENTDPKFKDTNFKNWLVIIPGVAHISKKLYEKGVRYFQDNSSYGTYKDNRIAEEFKGKETGENRVSYEIKKIDNKETKVGFINLEPDFVSFQQPKKMRELTKFIEELPGKKVPYESSTSNKRVDVKYKF